MLATRHRTKAQKFVYDQLGDNAIARLSEMVQAKATNVSANLSRRQVNFTLRKKILAVLKAQPEDMGWQE